MTVSDIALANFRDAVNNAYGRAEESETRYGVGPESEMAWSYYNGLRAAGAILLDGAE